LAKKRSIATDWQKRIRHPISVVFYNGKFIVGTETEICEIDPDTRKLRKAVESEPMVAFLVVKELGLVCGTANGSLEIRDFETLDILHSSTEYDTRHSELRARSSFVEFGTLQASATAIKSIDYLKKENMLLSISNAGEIYLWNPDLFPYAHISFPFAVGAACLLSDGSILLSAYCSLLKIDAEVLFEKAVEAARDLSQRELTAPTPPRSPRLPKSPRPNDRVLLGNKKRLRRVASNPDLSASHTPDPDFIDLVVEEDLIPKQLFIVKKNYQKKANEKLVIRASLLDKLKRLAEEEADVLKRGLDIPEDLEPKPLERDEVPGVERVHMLAGKVIDHVREKVRKSREKSSKREVFTPVSHQKRFGVPTNLIYGKEGSAVLNDSKYDDFNMKSKDRWERRGLLASTYQKRGASARSTGLVKISANVSAPQSKRVSERRDIMGLGSPRRAPVELNVSEKREDALVGADTRILVRRSTTVNEPVEYMVLAVNEKREEEEEAETEPQEEAAEENENGGEEEEENREIDGMGRLISIDAMNVEFIQPDYGYGSALSYDLAQLEKELQARESTVVIGVKKEANLKRKVESLKKSDGIIGKDARLDPRGRTLTRPLNRPNRW
jgi:hypothetical protein